MKHQIILCTNPVYDKHADVQHEEGMAALIMMLCDVEVI